MMMINYQITNVLTYAQTHWQSYHSVIILPGERRAVFSEFKNAAKTTTVRPQSRLGADINLVVQER